MRKTGLNNGHTKWSVSTPYPSEHLHWKEKHQSNNNFSITSREMQTGDACVCFSYSLNFLQGAYVIRKSSFNKNFIHREDLLPSKVGKGSAWETGV